MHRPGALLELQLPPLDVELLRALLLALELGEQLARLVLRGDEAERAGDQQREQDEVEPRHLRRSAALSATRRTALRARGLAATSCGRRAHRLADQAQPRLRQFRGAQRQPFGHLRARLRRA